MDRTSKSDGAARTPPALDPTAPVVSLNTTHHLRPFMDLAAEYGCDTDRVLSLTGLTREAFVDPKTRITFERTQWLLQQFITPVNRSDVGLIAAERYGPTDFDILGYLTALSSTAWECLNTLARYSRLICDSLRYDIVRSEEVATVSVSVAGGRTLLPQAMDCQVAALYRMLCFLTGKELRPLEVRLTRPRPSDAEPFRKYFGVPVRFAAASDALSYSPDALQTPLWQRNDRLKELLSEQADRMIEALPARGNFVERVRHDIRTQLEHGEASSQTTARRLGMSERTLRRYLSVAGRSYRMLCEDVRRERALVLLREGKRSISEVAQVVGFSNAAAFARAVRRWTGTYPKDYARRAKRPE